LERAEICAPPATPIAIEPYVDSKRAKPGSNVPLSQTTLPEIVVTSICRARLC